MKSLKDFDKNFLRRRRRERGGRGGGGGGEEEEKIELRHAKDSTASIRKPLFPSISKGVAIRS